MRGSVELLFVVVFLNVMTHCYVLSCRAFSLEQFTLKKIQMDSDLLIEIQLKSSEMRAQESRLGKIIQSIFCTQSGAIIWLTVCILLKIYFCNTSKCYAHRLDQLCTENTTSTNSTTTVSTSFITNTCKQHLLNVFARQLFRRIVSFQHSLVTKIFLLGSFVFLLLLYALQSCHLLNVKYSRNLFSAKTGR